MNTDWIRITPLPEHRQFFHFYIRKRLCFLISAESLLSLQIPLAIFVVISTLSTILNIYFYINIKSRNKSKKDKTNSNVIMSNRGGSEPNAETYTELGNTATRESENQYESITRQENNMNTNVL